ncbi:unnamed protein product [Allacma fusca]|uniref:Eukaryotic translation initiation factor 2 subunit 2 n=1 Tax=Allacma fusca TaxID=39272 RepID=A0A8J2P9C7_9HEXA|nr:unnamed protein product [Allacma fusca]
MAEEDPMFDPSLMKKKKKSKKPFDLDSAISSDAAPAVTSQPGEQQSYQEKENVEPAGDKNNEDASLLDLDLESFGKKKKKKKGALNIEDGEKKDKETEVEDAGIPVGGEEDEKFNMDFTKKKKKTRKVNIDDLVQATEEGDEISLEGGGEGGEDASTGTGPTKHAWLGSDRDYTYDELLNRVFDIMRLKNPDMASGTKQKFVMRPPQVVRVGTKKTSFVNFMEICKMLHRHQKHLLDFLLSELGTSGSIDGNNQLIIKGRFQQKQIENVLRRYIKEYVTCHTCRSPNTLLQKDSRLFFLQCEVCGSRCSVASIKHGFQAVTGKRAAIRAKAT